MARDRFMFFENFMATAELLDDKNKLAFYNAIFDYVFKDAEPTDPYIAALLNAIKPSLDKVDGRCRNGGNHNPTGKNQHTAKLVNSGQSRSKLVKSVVNSGQFLSETETETEIKETEKEIHKEKESDVFVAELEKEELAKEKKTRFIKPTLEQIKDYCKERNNNIDAEYFYDYYERNGWKVSKNPMKDWRACIRTWERNNFNRTPQKAKSISSPDYVGEGSFLRRAEDDPFCADL